MAYQVTVGVRMGRAPTDTDVDRILDALETGVSGLHSAVVAVRGQDLTVVMSSQFGTPTFVAGAALRRLSDVAENAMNDRVEAVLEVSARRQPSEKKDRE